MDDLLIGRVFTELDNHSKRLEDLAEIVHTNAATLSIVTKLVVALIIIVAGSTVNLVYTNITKHREPVALTRHIDDHILPEKNGGKE